ncbi:MAG: copper amine oxidase N-terminal domain-containing protein, partial [Syntrophomonadaceae bacterium]
MKRKATILLTLIMVLIMATPTWAANLELNGKAYQPAQAANIESGVTRVTPDVIINILGCDATVDGNSITITEGDHIIQMTMGSPTAVVNGETQTMPLAPEVIDGKTYLPLRSVLEAAGAAVAWDGDTGTIAITYNETRDG